MKHLAPEHLANLGPTRKSPAMRQTRTLSMVALCAVLPLAALGCGASGQYVWVDNAPEAFFKPRGLLTIASGDVVSVRVFGQDALSVRSTVRVDGAITMPLVGDVIVAGKAPQAVAKELEARLLPFFTAPNVVVVVEESRVRVVGIGELRRNGTIILEAGETTMVEALANAGGITEFASNSRIFVLRRDASGLHRIRFQYEDIVQGVGKAATFRLQNGDQIVVE